MLHAFIDTNVYLSLYAFTDDNVEELRKLIVLIKNKKLKVYLTTTVHQEFYKNRDQKLTESIEAFKKSSLSSSTPRFLEHYDEYAEFRDALKTALKKKSVLLDKAVEEIINMALPADKLYQEIKSEAKLLQADPKIVEAAESRTKSDRPPGKPGSIGDRINWLTLKKLVPDGEDIHLVSRDKDFSSPLGSHIPNSYLSQEWSDNKKAKMHSYVGIKEFVKANFPDIKLASDLDKHLAIADLVDSESWQETRNAIERLTPLLPAITLANARSLFSALVDNYEIHSISDDSDVEQFFHVLLTKYWDSLPNVELEKVEIYIKDYLPF